MLDFLVILILTGASTQYSIEILFVYATIMLFNLNTARTGIMRQMEWLFRLKNGELRYRDKYTEKVQSLSNSWQSDWPRA